MLEGSGALRVADALVLARVSRQTPQRGDDAAFARLLFQVAAASKPAAPVAGGMTAAAHRAPALSSDARPASTADAGYPRPQKATGGAKADTPGAASDVPTVQGASVDFAPDDPEPAPQAAVEWLVREAYAQAAIVLSSGRAECLLRFASPDLGVVRVLVVQTRDGVNIRFVAEQELTRQALDRQLNQLYAALANAGVDLGVMDVVGEADAGFPQEPSDVEGEGSPGEGRRAARPRRPGSPPATGRLDVIV
jgi:flagellar hook-length control protein FliK